METGRLRRGESRRTRQLEQGRGRGGRGEEEASGGGLTLMKAKRNRDGRGCQRRDGEISDGEGSKGGREAPQQQFDPLSVSGEAPPTFLLPSVTMRGTGIGGHLFRFGGGFSLFHRMMICGVGGQDRTHQVWSSPEKSNLCFFYLFICLPVSSIWTWTPPGATS